MPTALSLTTANVPDNVEALAEYQNTKNEVRVPKKTLGQEDFLKLLSVQFQKQDPMKPMDDSAFIAQMAQFTGLEQTTAMSNQIAQLRSDTQFATASNLLGRQVTVIDSTSSDGSSVTGTVSGVDQTSSTPSLWVNGRSFPLTSLQKITPAPVADTVSS